MLTERALESFKQFVETNIAYAMVEYGGTTVSYTHLTLPTIA